MRSFFVFISEQKNSASGLVKVICLATFARMFLYGEISSFITNKHKLYFHFHQLSGRMLRAESDVVQRFFREKVFV